MSRVEREGSRTPTRSAHTAHTHAHDTACRGACRWTHAAHTKHAQLARPPWVRASISPLRARSAPTSRRCVDNNHGRRRLFAIRPPFVKACAHRAVLTTNVRHEVHTMPRGALLARVRTESEKPTQMSLWCAGVPAVCEVATDGDCLLYTSPSPRDAHES
eukprot:3045837-Prymnesium_polylepis.2